MKQWLREGKIGEAVMIEANLSSDTGFAIQPGDWRSSKSKQLFPV
jgi:predicted dehydrogenase